VVTHSISWHIVPVERLSPGTKLGKHGAAASGRPTGRKKGAGEEWADFRFRLGVEEVKATGDEMLIHESLARAIREGSHGFDKAIIVKTLHSSSSSSSEIWL
jgi:hypothetical protein